MTQSFFSTFILLILVTDPFGNVPLFAAALKDTPLERRNRTSWKRCT
jgi:small neutral amino acid transporter SnatA (MarC family)